MPPALTPIGARRALAALLVLVASPGCGSGEELSRQDSNRLRATLDQVARRNDRGDCPGARSSASGLRRQIRTLDSEVDDGVRETLRTSAEHLGKLVREQCVPPPAPAISAPQAQSPPTLPSEPQPDATEPEEDGNGLGGEAEAETEREKQLEEARKERQQLLEQLQEQGRGEGGRRGGGDGGDEDQGGD